MVLCGFLGAIYLINDSYSDWQESPIATSISTHPIAELDFPTVTVCPPRGSHTALNYDLIKAGSQSLTQEDRKDLKQAAYEIFTKASHVEYVAAMLAAANPPNLREIYQGYQAPPRPYGHGGFETFLWNKNGKYQSPGFGGSYDERFYMANREYRMALVFPEDMMEQVGGGRLVIELEVDTREVEGWREEVRYGGQLVTSVRIDN